MEYSEKNFNERISSSNDKAVTSAAPLCATASANSGTVALSPRSSAFKGSRTAARSAVGLRVGVRAGRTRAVAQEVTSSSFGNLALRLPRVVAARIAAEAIAAQSIAVTNTQDSLSLLAKQACLSSLLAFPSTLVCHTLCLKNQDWIVRGGMRLVARKTLSFEGGRVNWRPLLWTRWQSGVHRAIQLALLVNMRRPTALLVIGGAVALVPRATPARPRTRLQASLDSFLADRSAAKLFYDGVTDGALKSYAGDALPDNSLDDQKKISALVDYMHTELMKKSMMAQSRRPAVLRCLHAIDARRLQE